jgi:hypothetical protein
MTRVESIPCSRLMPAQNKYLWSQVWPFFCSWFNLVEMIYFVHEVVSKEIQLFNHWAGNICTKTQKQRASSQLHLKRNFGALSKCDNCWCNLQSLKETNYKHINTLLCLMIPTSRIPSTNGIQLKKGTDFLKSWAHHSAPMEDK